MAMSRKNFVALASAIRSAMDAATEANSNEARAIVTALAKEVADHCRSECSAFDRQRFMHAAGIV